MTDPTALTAEERDAAWRERCDFCGWPLGPRDKGCAEPDDCSQRPRPHNALTTWKQQIRKLEAELASLRRERDELREIIMDAMPYIPGNSFVAEKIDKLPPPLGLDAARARHAQDGGN